MAITPDRLLEFSPVAAGGGGHQHIYYNRYYVGSINPSCGRWRVWHNGQALGDFQELEDAKHAVAQWYYGPRVE